MDVQRHDLGLRRGAFFGWEEDGKVIVLTADRSKSMGCLWSRQSHLSVLVSDAQKREF